MFSLGQFLKQIKSDDIATNKQVVMIPDSEEKPNERKDYTQLIRNGENKDRAIQGSLADVKPLRQRTRNLSLARPSQQEVDECTERTRRALDAVLQSKLGKPTTSARKNEDRRVYRYNTNSSSRMLQIVDVKQDPMAPVKFKQKKQLARPPSPPAPVLHAPERKITAAEQKEWYIPPAISNYKNPNGYAIALDKRLVADGRDPTANQGQEINQNAVDLVDALDDADKELREQLKMRNALKKKLAEKELREREEKTKFLAQQIREKKASSRHIEYENEGERRRALDREERRRRAERELKMSRMGNEQKIKMMSNNLMDRDVSERTQLGVAKASKSAENQFDSRLFTQATQITNSEDQVYDNPLFAQRAVNDIYKVKNNNHQVSDDVINDMNFESRFENLGPVEFEKSPAPKRAHEHETDGDQSADAQYGLQTKRQKT